MITAITVLLSNHSLHLRGAFTSIELAGGGWSIYITMSNQAMADHIVRILHGQKLESARAISPANSWSGWTVSVSTADPGWSAHESENS